MSEFDRYFVGKFCGAIIYVSYNSTMEGRGSSDPARGKYSDE